MMSGKGLSDDGVFDISPSQASVEKVGCGSVSCFGTFPPLTAWFPRRRAKEADNWPRTKASRG